MLRSLPTNIIIPDSQRSFADQFLTDKKVSFLPVSPKVCFHGAGIPGSGKTSELLRFVAQNQKWSKHPLVIIGNDDVMQEMPDYQDALRNHGPEKAFSDFELPARAIGYEFLRQAVKSGCSLLLDHSATAEYRPELLTELKEKHGYKIIMVHVHCAVEEALRRSVLREQQTGRHVPPSYFPERQAILERLLPVYRGIVHEFHTIDNSTPRV